MTHRVAVLLFVTLGLLAVNLTGKTAQAGTIEGNVRVLAGPAPAHGPSSPFARRRPVEGHEEHGHIPARRQMIVYLAAHSNLKSDPPPAVNPKMNQIDLEIVPGFLAVPVGTTIDFPNSDDVYHNLFSVSSPAKFDLGRYGQGRVKDVTFLEPGEVRIFCDIHPHMSAIVIVLPNAYWAEVDDDGNFTIPNVPAGEYELRAWHEDFGEKTKRVSVATDSRSTVTFTFAPN